MNEKTTPPYEFKLTCKGHRTSPKNTSLGNVPSRAERDLGRLPHVPGLKNPDHRMVRITNEERGVDFACRATFFTSGSEITIPKAIYHKHLFPLLRRLDSLALTISTEERRPRQAAITKWEQKTGRSYTEYIEGQERKQTQLLAEYGVPVSSASATSVGGTLPQTPEAPMSVAAAAVTAENLTQDADTTLVSDDDLDAQDEASESDFDDDDGSAKAEGRLVLREHVTRLRDRSLVARKKQQAPQPLACEICALDFESKYGDIGRGFMEVHHREPLAERDGEAPTTLDDLMLVCANCHAMVHRLLARNPSFATRPASFFRETLLGDDGR